jgi:hypothetical protein
VHHVVHGNIWHRETDVLKAELAVLFVCSATILPVIFAHDMMISLSRSVSIVVGSGKGTKRMLMSFESFSQCSDFLKPSAAVPL